MAHPIASGRAVGGAWNEPACSASAKAPGGSGAEGSAGSPAVSAEWGELSALPAFWLAVSTLRAAEELFAELAKLPPAEGIAGDGGEPISEGAAARGAANSRSAT